LEDKIQNKVNIIIHTEIETIEWSIGNKILNAFLDFDEKLISQSLNRLIRGYLTFSSNYLEGIDWSKLFDRLTDILQSDRAFLQVHNDIETRMFELTDFDRLSNLANVSIIPIDVKSVRTPIKHIDENIAEKIKNNGFFIEKLPNAYKIKVCKNIHDFVNDFEGFCRKRAHLKSLFPEGSFKVKEEPISIS